MSRGRDLPATEIALLRTVRSAVWGQMPVWEHHAVAATGFAPVRREVVTMKSEGGPTTAEITGRAAERRTTPAVGRIAERFVAMIVAPAGVRRIAAVRGSLLCPTIQPSSSTGVTLAEMLRQHVACGVLAVRLRRRRAASTIPFDQPV